MAVPVPGIIIHPTNTVCNNQNTCSQVMRSIQYQNIAVNGFHDIAYHFVIGADGNVYEGRGWFPRGALEDNRNQKAFSLAYIGSQSPTATMTAVYNRLVACAKLNNYLAAAATPETGNLHTVANYAVQPVQPVPVRPVQPIQPVQPVIPAYDYNSSDYYDYGGGGRVQPNTCPAGYGPGMGPYGYWMPCINYRYNYTG